MKFLVAILEAVLRVLVPVLIERSRRTAEDSASRPALRERLRRRVRNSWGKVMPVCLVVLLLSSGCSTRTVYVPSGEPVRLRETIPDARVWVLDEGGRPVAGVMDLPAGWYCLPVPEEKTPQSGTEIEGKDSASSGIARHRSGETP